VCVYGGWGGKGGRSSCRRRCRLEALTFVEEGGSSAASATHDPEAQKRQDAGQEEAAAQERHMSVFHVVGSVVYNARANYNGEHGEHGEHGDHGDAVACASVQQLWSTRLSPFSLPSSSPSPSPSPSPLLLLLVLLLLLLLLPLVALLTRRRRLARRRRR
jgi:hypothetical protein